MSLGWLNLQDYLGANAGVVDEEAQRASDAALNNPAGEAASMSYGEYLARRRQLSTDAGRAALVNGGTADGFLAGRGRAVERQPNIVDQEAVRRQRESERKAELDYWAKQATRNSRLTAESDAAKQKQTTDYDNARRAIGRLPGYGSYSNAVDRSFEEARRPGREIRVISDEEYRRRYS